MKKGQKTIYYVGVAKEKITEEKPGRHIFGRKKKADLLWKHRELPVYKLPGKLSYEGGEIQIYYSLLPESILDRETGKKKKSSENKYLQVRNHFADLAASESGAELVLSADLTKEAGQGSLLPMELYGVCLKQIMAKEQRSGSRKGLTVSLPKDAGPMTGENLLLLLEPYLARINSMAWLEEESGLRRELEAYLYEEYGILSYDVRKPEENTLWLDISGRRELRMIRYAGEKGIYCLNETEVLKFLDTIVKNGYNTEVN